MYNELFEKLLYEEESAILDFKKEQYRFVKATDDEKSELLKDILGFSNAWRRSEAYILIGVEDTRGGRGNVVGIAPSDHLDDHSLQQFVSNLTNQPVRFHYEAFGFEGKQVGIIRIDEQTRPIYLKRDYGKLVREKVYIRRGSSTDPAKPASLEEIAQMRVGIRQFAAELVVEFADKERDDSLGPNIAWAAELCKMPAKDTIPDLTHQRHQYPVIINPLNQTNTDFFREYAHFEFMHRLFRPVRLVVKNIGQVAANNVRTELTLPMNRMAMILDASEMPHPPKQYDNFLGNPVLEGIRPMFRREPGEVSIDKNNERFRVEIDCGDLQPGRRVWSDIFYIGTEISEEILLRGLIFADNLPQPKDFALNVSIVVSNTSMTIDELCSLPK